MLYQTENVGQTNTNGCQLFTFHGRTLARVEYIGNITEHLQVKTADLWQNVPFCREIYPVLNKHVQMIACENGRFKCAIR